MIRLALKIASKRVGRFMILWVQKANKVRNSTDFPLNYEVYRLVPLFRQYPVPFCLSLLFVLTGNLQPYDLGCISSHFGLYSDWVKWQKSVTSISERNPVYRYEDSMPHQHIVEEERAKISARRSTLDRAVRLYIHFSREELESSINEWYLRHDL